MSDKNNKPFVKRAHLGLLSLFILVGIVVAPIIYAQFSTRSIRYSFGDQSIPSRQVAIVFGAGIRNNATPSPLLARRVEAAVKLYNENKVEKIIVSGDNRESDYNEPLVMQRYAESLGVPAADIIRDDLGLDTFDTCRRAKEVFDVESAVLNTQEYHLPRAVVSCRSVGIDAIGHEAENRLGRYNINYVVREIPAMVKASLQILL